MELTAIKQLVVALFALLFTACSMSRVIDFMSGPYPSVSPYKICYGWDRDLKIGVYRLYSPQGKQLGQYWDKPTAWAAANAMIYGDRENSIDIERDQ